MKKAAKLPDLHLWETTEINDRALVFDGEGTGWWVDPEARTIVQATERTSKPKTRTKRRKWREEFDD